MVGASSSRMVNHWVPSIMSSFGRVSGQAPARLLILLLLAAELPGGHLLDDIPLVGLHLDSNWLSLAGDVPVTV